MSFSGRAAHPAAAGSGGCREAMCRLAAFTKQGFQGEEAIHTSSLSAPKLRTDMFMARSNSYLFEISQLSTSKHLCLSKVFVVWSSHIGLPQQKKPDKLQKNPKTHSTVDVLTLQ